MEELELICFKIISAAGEAKSNLMEALKKARLRNFKESEEFISKAEEELSKAHEVHLKLVQKEAEGEKVPTSMLLMHSEDQLMSVETLMLVVQELINVYKNI